MKTRVLTLLSLSLLFAGCGQGFKTVNYGTVDPEFEPYVEKFMELTGTTVAHIDIYFDEQQGNVIGMCIVRGQERDIEIDPDWWSWVSEADREELIFHELAHCQLGQGHSNYNLSDNCPGSIMDEYHIGQYCYLKHYDYYISELVNGGPL